MDLVILRLPEVLRKRGRSRSAHYRDIEDGLFPKPVHIGEHSIGWPEHEVQTINAARIAGKTDEEIKTLVATLEKARITFAA